MRNRVFAYLLIAVVIGSTLAACSSSTKDQPGQTSSATSSSAISSTRNPELQGTITLSGAFALYPLAVRWGEEFQKLNPKVRVDVSAGGAGKGMTDVLGGLADIGMISRAIDPTEIDKGAYPIGVAKDAVVAIVNARNPVLKDLLGKGMKKSALADLFINGKAETWGEIVGRAEVKDRVTVYTRSDSSGAADIWAQYLGGKKQDSLKGVGVSGDPGILAAVQNDPLGIAFSNYNYAYDLKSGLPIQGIQPVPFDVNENGVVDAAEDISNKDKVVAGIKSGAFPHPPARVEYFVTKGKPSGLDAEFIRWSLTDGQKFIDEVGYVQLTNDSLAAELKKVN